MGREAIVVEAICSASKECSGSNRIPWIGGEAICSASKECSGSNRISLTFLLRWSSLKGCVPHCAVESGEGPGLLRAVRLPLESRHRNVHEDCVRTKSGNVTAVYSLSS
ncbi:hypothetical protein TIFTF001_043942 [Ficus carica]|uniref:Uncharacterized protein n=1 Tax=Ficus carica TaxID=3494 RepID=A0AA87Z042_FICCA|nr:hypothetical protein TIFTF001_043942 [Ficus carica]